MLDVTAQLNTALDLLERLGVEVRDESLGGPDGGLCVLRGRRILFLDPSLPEIGRLDVTVRALSTIREVDDLFVPPALRARLDSLRTGGQNVD